MLMNVLFVIFAGITDGQVITGESLNFYPPLKSSPSLAASPLLLYSSPSVSVLLTYRLEELVGDVPVWVIITLSS